MWMTEKQSMNVIKCKMCGGDLEIKQGSTIAVCTYCGTQQTVLTADNERKTKLYNRAHELRLNNDFDQALGVFETIIAEFPDEAEAYWGLCLCKYGIEYVDDPITKLKVPTCHRTCYDSIMNDDDYRRAVDLAGITARNLYYNEAIQIDAIQRTILTIARNERPYDIFICYKESDGRQRTKGSVLAQDIYDVLVDQGGYKVFFSRITLEDKLGEEFEPYIFSALNTAKVMLVVGTSNSNMNSVWVKNEWSRYLKLMKSDKSKLLIPCYADMDAYDLPEEFRNLQAQDMNKIGFMQDLLRGIKKVVNPSGAASEKMDVSVDVNKLLKRVENFIEENNWTSAKEYCERILDSDPDNVQAYLYKLLIDKRVTEVKALKNCSDSFENNVNYQRLIKIADEKLKQELKGYIDHIREKKNRERIAREKAEIIRKQKFEADRRKRNKVIIISTIIILSIIVISLVTAALVKVIIPGNKYNKALVLKKEGNLDDAEKIFVELGLYKDSRNQLSEISELRRIIELNQPVGESVFYGMYEQDGDESNGKEPLEWIVIDNSNDEITLLSKNEIEYIRFSDKSYGIWENSSLRKWLNADFYSMAFSESEKNRIENNSLHNPASGSFINKDTKDKVFVLSSLDVTKYEIELDVLNSRLTDYAKKKISDAKAREQRQQWWLRDVFEASYGVVNAYYVDNDGNINEDGYTIDARCGLRPVIRVSLDINQDLFEADEDSFTVGSHIKFGSYEQDANNANGSEPIEWCVLTQQGDKYLLLSDKILLPAPNTVDDTISFQQACQNVLNSAFDENVFSEEEKSKIIKTDGNYVFIPSEQIVNELYDMDRACNVSKYAEKEGVIVSNNNTGIWVMHTSRESEPTGKARLYVQVINASGTTQHIKGNGSFGLRPALWITANKNSEIALENNEELINNDKFDMGLEILETGDIPEDVTDEQLIEIGRLFIENKEYSKVKKLIVKIKTANKDEKELLYILGTSYLNNQDYQGAIEQFTDLLYRKGEKNNYKDAYDKLLEAEYQWVIENWNDENQRTQIQVYLMELSDENYKDSDTLYTKFGRLY